MLIDLDRMAAATVNFGADAYFDNDTILDQFESQFQMLELEQEYNNN